MQLIFIKLRNLLERINIDHRRIARGMLLVFSFVLIGKVIGAIKDASIAYRFGIGEVVDVYSLALVYALWAPVVIGGALNSIYIPLIHKLGPDEKQDFKNQLFGLGLITSGLITVALVYFLPKLLFHDSAPNNLGASAGSITLTFALISALGILSALFSMMLLADERHANTIFDAVPSLAILAAVLIWSTEKGMAIDPLLGGSMLGFSLQAAGLFLLLKKTGSTFKPQLSFRSRGWHILKQSFGVVILGQFVLSWIDPVSFNIAENTGVGNVSGLNYSSKIVLLFLSLGAVAVSRAILPVFSNTDRGNKQRLRLAIQWSTISFIGGVAAAIFLFFFAPEIVRIVYERGAFNSADTDSIAQGVKLGALQLPFYFSGVVLAQLFLSLGSYRLILLSAIVALVVKISFCLLLAPTMGFSGIMLASVPMYMATNILFALKLSQINKGTQTDN